MKRSILQEKNLNLLKKIFSMKMLNEQEDQLTRGLSGNVKKAIKDLKALSKTNPGLLMKNLKISGVGEKKGKENQLQTFLKQATQNSIEMAKIYSALQRQSDSHGRIGFLLGVAAQDLSARDGAFFIRHAMHGGKNSGQFNFGDKVQIELLGNDILVYFSEKPFSWNKEAPPRKPDKKPKKSPEEPDKLKEKPRKKEDKKEE
jgi:hypothetical protein